MKYKYLYIFVGIIILLIILRFLYVFNSLEKEDKESLILMLKYGKNLNVNNYAKLNSVKKYIKNIPYFLKDKKELMLAVEGIIYNYNSLKLELKDSKLFWNDLFTKYNINRPVLVSYKYNGIIKSCSDYDLNDEFIMKPILGMCGVGIRKIKGSEIEYELEINNDVIIQKRLVDCFIDYIRHFRFISLYNGKVFLLWEFYTDKSKNMSNISQGGSAKLILYKNKFYHNNEISNEETSLINDTMNKLLIVHKNEFPESFSIGWDIMISCEENGNKKSVCLEGNFLPTIYFKTNNTKDEIINDIMVSYRNEYIQYKNKVIKPELK